MQRRAAWASPLGVGSVIGVALICGSLVPPADAATLAEQRTQLRRVARLARSAQQHAKAGRVDDAAEAFAQARNSWEGVAEEGVEPRLRRSHERAGERLREIGKELAEAGIDVGDLPPPPPALGRRPGDKDAPVPREASFVRDVAPMLAAKCGACHIDQQRGGFSLATYRDLMRGSRDGGRVIVPGDGMTSLIVELIAAGDMPRGGGRVSPVEARTLVTWITQGAKFDGRDENANLRSLRAAEAPSNGAAQPADRSAPVVKQPTGNETVSFALDVAPILSSRCGQCHGGRRPRSGLSVANFAALLRGGDGGAAVVPGDPEASPLVRRVRGDDRPRMPLGMAALTKEQIATLATWVREGAPFDGGDPQAPLDRVTGLARAARWTADELSAERAELAQRNWRLAVPDEPARSVTTERFLVMGNLPEARLGEIGGEAERLVDGVLKLFGHPADEPLSKGRLTLLVFGSRVDYSEFGLMVRKRPPPKGERGVAGHDLVDAYAALQLGAAAQDGDASVIAEQLAAVYLMERTKGGLPDWLVDGAARVAAAKASPKDPRIADWNTAVPVQVARLDQPQDLLGDRLPPEAAGPLRYGFALGLMRNAGRLRSVIQSTADNRSFDDAFQNAYRHPPQRLVELWANSVRKRR